MTNITVKNMMKSLDQLIAEVGSMIGDKTRALMLIALMDGRSLTAGELALRANVSAQTASNHLSKLMRANLIVSESSGRHRYYKLASNDVANALEAISVLAGAPKRTLSKLNKLDRDICFARTCYDHLAGELGVTVTNALLDKKVLTYKDENFSLSDNGKQFFSQLGISVDDLLKARRQFAKPCLDWTERKYHLAGSLGAALLAYFLNNKFLLRSKQKPRVVILTTKGTLWLKKRNLL